MLAEVVAAGDVLHPALAEDEEEVVARLEGTNVDDGKKLLNESGLKIISADDLTDAANKVVAAVSGGAS